MFKFFIDTFTVANKTHLNENPIRVWSPILVWSFMQPFLKSHFHLWLGGLSNIPNVEASSLWLVTEVMQFFFVPAEFKFHAWCPCCFKIWFNYFWKKLLDTEWLRLGHEHWKKESQMILNSGPRQVFSSRSKHFIMQFLTS